MLSEYATTLSDLFLVDYAVFDVLGFTDVYHYLFPSIHFEFLTRFFNPRTLSL